MVPTVGTETSQKLLSAEHRVRAGWDSVCKSNLQNWTYTASKKALSRAFPIFASGNGHWGAAVT